MKPWQRQLIAAALDCFTLIFYDNKGDQPCLVFFTHSRLSDGFNMSWSISEKQRLRFLTYFNSVEAFSLSLYYCKLLFSTFNHLTDPNSQWRHSQRFWFATPRPFLSGESSSSHLDWGFLYQSAVGCGIIRSVETLLPVLSNNVKQ